MCNDSTTLLKSQQSTKNLPLAELLRIDPNHLKRSQSNLRKLTFVLTSVGQFLIFMKNLWFQFQTWFQNSSPAWVWILLTGTEIGSSNQCWAVLWQFKESLVLVVSKTSKNDSFHEKINYSLVGSLIKFSFFWELWLYIKNLNLLLRTGRYVNIFIPRLITGRYLSFILRTTQHWNVTWGIILFHNWYACLCTEKIKWNYIYAWRA